MAVKLVSVTPDAEKLMAYCARVSNPSNQENPNYAKLLKYCIDHQHWSIFEQAFMTVEINTTRGLAAQILRHRSFTFQEFSQRYADATVLAQEIPLFELRRQDTKNRQNSVDNIEDEIKSKWGLQIREHFSKAKAIYDGMIKDGIAKECARFVLPLATPTKLYMSGTIRSWIHYIELRSGHGTQKEHMDIANEIKGIFIEQFPIISEAMEWNTMKTTNTDTHESWWENNLGAEKYMHNGAEYPAPTIQTFESWMGDHNAPDRVAARQLLKEYDSFLDAGCGAAPEFRAVDPSKYTGLDITKKLVEYNQSRGIKCVHGTLMDIPFPNNSFDVTISRHVVEHMAEIETPLEELIRVSKKQVVLFFFIEPLDSEQHSISLDNKDTKWEIYHNTYSKKLIESLLKNNKKVANFEWIPGCASTRCFLNITVNSDQ